MKCGQRTPLSERVISEHESEDVLKCHQEIDLRNAIFQITGVNWLKVEEGLTDIKKILKRRVNSCQNFKCDNQNFSRTK